MDRRVAVVLGVMDAVGGFTDSNVNTEIPVGVSAKVNVAAGQVAVKVGVKKSLANSALVRALSMLIVAVGVPPPPVLGISSLGSIKPCCDPLVIMIGNKAPMRQDAKTANTTMLEYWPFIDLLSFLPSSCGKHQPLLVQESELIIPIIKIIPHFSKLQSGYSFVNKSAMFTGVTCYVLYVL